mmetsp:Transcript_863/g.1624  ORF Transcript_863/g.1624 Transcript_863/m.1624 type:complete len:95 (+) Transcript_863:686-970(+)
MASPSCCFHFGADERVLPLTASNHLQNTHSELRRTAAVPKVLDDYLTRKNHGLLNHFLEKNEVVALPGHRVVESVRLYFVVAIAVRGAVKAGAA